ncbi:MAG: outer membrane protein assembly factor BamD, partial [Alistipes sp.]|nr:outer membrane protein assembly factor BamD [Candidatus Minthomonas equi]
MMKKTSILTVLMAVVLAASSCKSQYEMLLSSQDVQEKYKGAFEYFGRGKYSKAASLFESMKLIVSGLPQEDTVNYYTALSHYRFGDLVTAESAFSSFYSSFPQSPFVNEARFLYLECLYSQTLRYELDQLPTHKAMSAVNEFMIDFPDNEYSARCMEMLDDFKNRLERKAFEAARIYYTTEDYKAAHYAF